MLHYITSVRSCSQMNSVPAVTTCFCLREAMLAVGLLDFYLAEGPCQLGLAVRSEIVVQNHYEKGKDNGTSDKGLCSALAKLSFGCICSRAWLTVWYTAVCWNNLSIFQAWFHFIQRARRERARDREGKSGGFMLESRGPGISILACVYMFVQGEERVCTWMFCFAYTPENAEVTGGNCQKPQSPTFLLRYPLCTILSFSSLSTIMSPNAL